MSTHPFHPKIIELLPHLEYNVKGQSQAIARIVPVIQDALLSLSDPEIPPVTFLMAGPTGTGKTSSTIAFSNLIFGPAHLYRFNMSEFKHADSIKNFIGDETGATGRLGAVLKETSEGTLLFDEIEKAHPDILDLFLQILEPGEITLGTGEHYTLRKFWMVVTTNIGGAEVMDAPDNVSYQTLEDQVLDAIYDELRPELIGRFKEVIVFNRLATSVQEEIIRLEFERTRTRFAKSHSLDLHLGDSALHFLRRTGISTKKGAREARNAVARHVQAAIRNAFLNNEIPSGYLILNSNNNGLTIIPHDNYDPEQSQGTFDTSRDPYAALGITKSKPPKPRQPKT